MRFVGLLFLYLLIFNNEIFSQSVSQRIHLNQLGFYPGAPKVAVVTGDNISGPFYITSTNLRDTLFSGTLSQEKHSSNSTNITRLADFSSLHATGSYVVLIPLIGHSYVFQISNEALQEVAIASIKGFYYQRASMPLEKKYAGKWHRSAGHPDNKVLIHGSAASKERPEGFMISTPGGWYDAGDYNKYMVNSGISTGTLLSAYEDFTNYFNTLNTNIPESSDQVPDILNEIIYNLRWMLSMQDPHDGGVYNKCTNANFDGMVLPGITTSPRYVVQKGTAATLDLAAVAAQASRVLNQYQKSLPGLSDSCLKAAQKAWKWATLHPSLEYNQDLMNQQYNPVISTGGYGDKNFRDEWLWAAMELYVTTKDKEFENMVNTHLSDTVNLPGWNSVGLLAYYSFLRLNKKTPIAEHQRFLKMKDRVMELANNYLDRVASSAFATVMGGSVNDFNWGSNSNACNQGVLLINAYLLSGDKKYVDAALSNADYILGRNATGYCFVTGLGSQSPMFPHHRQSASDGIVDPVPGLLVGGPNPGRQDHCTYAFTDPETSYADEVCSYASNEIAINWNAPLVYLVNALEAVKSKVAYTLKK